MVTDLSKTKQYLANRYNPKEGQTIVLVAVLCLIAIAMGIRSLVNGGGSWLLIITVFGCGSTIAAGYKRFVQQFRHRSQRQPELRSDLVELGRELHELSESTSFAKRVAPEVALAVERAADASLAALNALKSTGKDQTDLADEVEPGIHEAMHEVLSLASPFIRRTGTRRADFADRLALLDSAQAIQQIDLITDKVTAVRVALTGSESPTLRLDQTLNRLQELRQAETELDQSLSR